MRVHHRDVIITRDVDIRSIFLESGWGIYIEVYGNNYGVPFVSKLQMMLVFMIHAGIYHSCWYLRSMLVFTLHTGIVNTSVKCKYQHQP